MRHSDHLKRRRPRPLILVLLVAAVGAHAGVPAEAQAGTAAFVAVGRMVSPVLAAAGAGRSATGAVSRPAPKPTAPAGGSQDQEQRPAPPFNDPANGIVISVLGGTVFSGSSAFQTGGAFAYYFGEKATFGFEVEGDLTFGPGGRVAQVMGSFVYQTGARTSKFVPYFAGGVGYLRANTNLAEATQAVLTDLGVVPEPQTEQAPFVQFGGGVRFYIKPTIAFRADVRFAQVFLDLRVVGRSNYPMRRIAGMVSWDF